jgi:hypothetical protein
MCVRAMHCRVREEVDDEKDARLDVYLAAERAEFEWWGEWEDEDELWQQIENAGEDEEGAAWRAQAHAPPPLPDCAPSTTDVYVYWDLDNKYPEDADPLAVLDNLK